MSDNYKKFSRQTEIAGLASLQSTMLNVGDLAGLFGVDEETIKKDMQDLVKSGIDVHTKKSKGIFIHTPPHQSVIEERLWQYFVFSQTELKRDKELSQMILKHGSKFLGWIVLLQRSIEDKNLVEIGFKNVQDQAKKFIAFPLMFIQREGMWRVVVFKEGKIEQFHISRIMSVDVKKARLNPEELPKDKIDNLFHYSWGTWISDDQISIRLKLSDYWADWFQARPMVKNQKITKRGKDDHLFVGTVNNIEEVAKWIVSKRGVVAISPIGLKEKVIEIARHSISVHSKKR